MGAAEHMSAVTPLSVVQGAELSLVAALMTTPGAVSEVCDILQPAHFERDDASVIYAAILQCHHNGIEVNPLTVCEQLESAGTLERAGWVAGVVEIAATSVSWGTVASLAQIIIRDFDRNKIRKLGLRLVEMAESRSIDPSDLASLVASYVQQFNRKPVQSDLIVTVDTLHELHKAQTWAVKSVIPSNAVGMFFGASGTFKSFLALDYALHRAYGLPWLGRKTAKGVPVYLAAEGGAGLMRRVEAWHQQRGMDWRQCPMRFIIVPIHIQGDGANRIRAAIDSLDIIPSDIIIDTMSQTFAGEENSSTEVAGYLSQIGAELRKPYGSTVLIVHHTGHSATERPRGSSAILANVDFLFGVFRDEKEPIATLECVKQKDGDLWGPVSFALSRMVLGQDADGEEITSLAARHIAGAEEIIAAASRSTGAPSALVRLLNAIGSGAPESEVRDRFYQTMPEADSDAKRQAFYRAIRRAEGQQIITRQGDWISKNGGNGA